MKKNKVIYHKGIKIYHLDLSHLKNDEEIEAVLQESKNYIHAQPNESVVSLVSVEGMHFNCKIKEMLVDVIKSNKPYVNSCAVVGVESLLKVMLNGYLNLSGREIKPFSSLEKAKDWLVTKQNHSQLVSV